MPVATVPSPVIPVLLNAAHVGAPALSIVNNEVAAGFASFAKELLASEYNKSPAVYVVNPVPPRVNALADRRDHAGDLAAGGEGPRRLELVHVADDQPVRIVDRAGLDRNQHFPRAGDGGLDLVEGQGFGPADGVAADGFHGVLSQFVNVRRRCRASATVGRWCGWLQKRRSLRRAPWSAPLHQARSAGNRGGTDRA